MPRRGELIGPYRLVAPIGAGAMGEVWRARDERLQRHVALKILPAHLVEDLERRARMLREARAAAAIRHAGVVTLFDIVAHDGSDILVMELVEGRNIYELLHRDGKPALATALAWIEQIADAMAAAHARGILHRDLKAANVMVTPDGHIKVLDFGVAKLHDEMVEHPDSIRPAVADASVLARTQLATPPTSGVPAHLEATRAEDADSIRPAPRGAAFEATVVPPGGAVASSSAPDLASYRTQLGSMIGTPLYMSPEQVAGEQPDARSEVFSLGVLAYQILTGVPPYVGATLDELFVRISGEPPPPMRDVPDEVAAIVLRALARSPDARWPDMRAFRDAIAAERTRRARRRTPRTLLAGIALAVLLVLGAGTWWRSSQRAEVTGPGDVQVARALEEFDLFYTDKALSSLRAAVAVAPMHARAHAYLLLVGSASDLDRATTVANAKQVLARTDLAPEDRTLLAMGLALAEHGPAAARDALARAPAAHRRGLAFWGAELDYRAGRYREAGAGYRAVLADTSVGPSFRGRIYDHYSAVLLYLEDYDEALRIGTRYRDAFPGEADAIGAYSMTLSAAGRHAEAIAAAEATVRLAEREDTIAGLAKIVALSGDRTRAKELYRRALDRTVPGRRPLRRAALAMLHWRDGELDAARALVRPCLDGDDAAARERASCLFVLGIVEPALGERAAAALDALAAAATPLAPAYGAPATLARLVRARQQFFAGACAVDPGRADVAPPHPGTPPADAYDGAVDFYASYYIPYYASWARCERAALAATRR